MMAACTLRWRLAPLPARQAAHEAHRGGPAAAAGCRSGLDSTAVRRGMTIPGPAQAPQHSRRGGLQPDRIPDEPTA